MESLKPEPFYITEKEIGETPLECLERFRAIKNIGLDVSMTYAGRLDPMASGKLIILVGEECKNKEKYLDVDKEYEVEIVFGIETDTHDMLGLATRTKNRTTEAIDFGNYIGKFKQEYPSYSSKTVGGVQLHELARNNKLPENMPTKEVEIYSINIINKRAISSTELLEQILDSIKLVKGDFRQKEIKNKWIEILNTVDEFTIVKIRVSCSSGTYMRSLAHRMGQGIATGAFALSIRRTKIGTF